MRGPQGMSKFNRVYARITPACAGTTTASYIHLIIFQDHPRLCGDHLFFFLFSFPVKGSPPPVRGPLSFPILCGNVPGITPACAGTTIHNTFCHFITQDHPRLCGDHQGIGLYKPHGVGSPPPVRGPPIVQPAGAGGCGITPACAGTTIMWFTKNVSDKDHPRLCGDHV